MRLFSQIASELLKVNSFSSSSKEVSLLATNDKKDGSIRIGLRWQEAREARQALTHYFMFYNQERLHQALDYQTSAEVYFHKPETRNIENTEQQKRKGGK